MNVCVVQARATYSGQSRWVERAAAKLGLETCYCTINIKHFNLQPWMIKVKFGMLYAKNRPNNTLSF